VREDFRFRDRFGLDGACSANSVSLIFEQIDLPPNGAVGCAGGCCIGTVEPAGGQRLHA